MLTLYNFGPGFGLPDPSPFCLKVETYLRMTGLPYATRAGDVRKSPKGKLPVLDDAGVKIPDSSLIIDYLKKKYGDRLDSHLTDNERALSLALQRLMEEHLYWVIVYTRWMEPEGWAVISKTFFDKLPFLVKKLIVPVIRKKIRGYLHSQGVGRHTREEIYIMGQKDLQALADFLGNKIYFLGDKPSSLDAIAYAFLANILAFPVDNALKQYAGGLNNLIQYCERMKKTYY